MSRMVTVFDAPQWKWREETDTDPDPIRISPVVVIYDNMRPLQELRVCVPAEFYHFIQSTHQGDVHVDGFNLQRVVNGRAYFSYDYTTPGDKGTITLWYYTKSTAPYWAKRYMK